jgi:hypothetical protein
LRGVLKYERQGKLMLQTLAYLAQIGGGLGIIVAAGSYLIHRNQLSFAVVANCNERFQDLLIDLEGEDTRKREPAKRRYVDLCNEQLFYFSRGHLPREVFEEWLESMVDYLPLFDEVTGEVHPDCRGVIDPELLEGYPTLKGVFVVEGPHDLAPRDRRLALVRRISRKVRSEPIPHVVWRDIRARFSRPNPSHGVDTATNSDIG